MTENRPESEVREERLHHMQEAGVNPYPSHSERTHTIAELSTQAEDVIASEKKVTIVGRIKSIRGHGGSTFVHIEDGTGAFQVYFKKDTIGEEQYTSFTEYADMGDFIQAEGTVFTTKRGEHTVLVEQWVMLSKALEPLPEKWSGLQDIEVRFRKRYLDLVSNESIRDIFVKRSKAITALRTFLNKAEYLEVETPLLQPLPGGANARPFKTHHNALEHDFYLQIAPELYLKRLIVGGYERVYTITRCFRNEGIDWSHNPEFTMLEFYQAYMDYEQLMNFTEDLVQYVVQEVQGSETITYQEQDITFNKPFKRATFRELLIEHADVDLNDFSDQASLYKKTQELGLKDVGKDDHRGKLADELYKEFVRPKLIQPTFMIDHPVELSPLAKKKADDSNYVERFQLIAGGVELINAFSELNDPIDQLERFQAQQESADKGDEEAHPIDMDYVEALRHGMPPTAGFGMGIDRFVGVLVDKKNIKEVILFPTLRPKTEEE